MLPIFFITFIESIGGTLLQRGFYFYTHEIRAFSETDNLLLALGYGVVYVCGALLSHRLATRFGERRLFTALLFALLTAHAALAVTRGVVPMVLVFLTCAGLQGMKWPIIESYVSAGRSPRELVPLLGRYNVTWAIAVFGAVGGAGLLIDSGAPALFFWLPAALNGIALLVSRTLPVGPAHSAEDHPERPPASEVAEMQTLLASARWSMTGSYALLFVLAPLMPGLMRDLGLGVELATPAASVMDGVRVLSFAALGAYAGWHGKRLPLAIAALLLPVGFGLILLGRSLGVVLLGEILFGAAAGFAYTAALYYALVSKNASVDAGGAHEGLIGLGLGLGPLAGLLGQWLAGRAGGGHAAAIAVAIAPVALACCYGALRRVWQSGGSSRVSADDFG